MTDEADALIAPKSDQLNADDLFTGPRTITITEAVPKGTDAVGQKLWIYFDGDGGRPYKPSLGMRRVLIHLWGRSFADWPGRRLTLFRDERVTFGKDEVGGIRISHMSHVQGEQRVTLTMSKASRKPWKVQPLAESDPIAEGMQKAIPWLRKLAPGPDNATKARTRTAALLEQIDAAGRAADRQAIEAEFSRIEGKTE